MPPDGRTEPDAETQHTHSECPRYQVVPRLVDDHEQGETEDRSQYSDQTHRR
jgi:hypothetical protein